MKKITIYKYISKLLVCLVSVLFFNTIQGQESKFKSAEKLFSTLNYKEAAQAYKKAYEKGAKDKLLFEHLGDSYYFNTDMRNANKWYGKLFEEYENEIDPEYYFRYAHSFQGLGKNNEAKRWMKQFSRLTEKSDTRKQNYVQAANELDAILNINSNYKIKNLSINTKYSDFGVGVYNDDIVYASSKTRDKNTERYQWNNQPFLNLYSASFSSDESNTQLESDKLFSNNINTEYHESNAVFNEDFTKIFFTRNNYANKLGSDDNGVNHLKLYSAELTENSFSDRKKWKNIKELPFNSDEYSVGHPALSDDGTKLFFTSDMPGSIGATDIFVVDILEDDQYSKPKNLGTSINTSGREMFPFTTNNKLYFASDGHLGFGGLDLFSANILNDSYQSPVNMGSPINSPKDDFAFVFDKASNVGFISSNRKGGKGDDDIYSIVPLKEKQEDQNCLQAINGIVSNILTDERLSNVQLDLYDELGVKKATTTSNEIGAYNFDLQLNCKSKYEVRASKLGYKTKVQPTYTEAITGNTYVPLRVETLDKLIVEEQGVLKLKIGIIYFNLDKDFIRSDASIELNKIVLVMSQYPKMHIKIESHTDSRSPNEYNRDLSDRRAKSTRDYLVSQGIEATRIVSAIGYGESRLINHCLDGVPCTESEHQLNRRSEFIIVKM